MADQQFDFSQLQGLLGQFSPSAQDEAAARRQALLAAALSLIGTRKGQEWDRVGYAGLNGLGAQQAYLQGVTQNKMRGMQAAGTAMDLLQKQQAMQQAAADRQALSGIFSGGPDLSQMGPGGPTADNAARIGPADAVAKYRKAAELYASQGRDEAAKKMNDIANSIISKYSTTPQVGIDAATGQPYQFVLNDRGEEKRLSAGAKPDFHEIDTGGSKEIVNYYNLPSTGTSFAKTMTPGEKASNQLGWANYGLSKNADARAAAAASGDKPVWDATAGQFVYPPSAKNPTGAAVSPAGFTKPEKPLTESQAKATAYVNQMQNANRELADLEKKGFTAKTYWQQGDLARAGTDNPIYGPLVRATASDEAQRFSNAELQWTEPVLRFMTGANAPKEEVIRNAATFFPRPGDSDEVIAQKAAARAAMEQSMRLAAGAGSDRVPQGGMRIRNEAEYNALPRGAEYIGPDGKRRRKQ